MRPSVSGSGLGSRREVLDHLEFRSYVGGVFVQHMDR